MIDQRESHYIQYLGALDQQVMHSTDLKPVHVDVYTFTPTDDRPFYTPITGGMSDLRQNIPDDLDIVPRAEIMMYVQEPKGWMYNVLKGLAEMPSDDDTFLSYRHTVPNGMTMTAEPSLLTSYFFVQPFNELEGFSPLIVEGDPTDILLLVPITEAEHRLAVEQGSDALLDLFSEKGLGPVVNEHRSCLVTGEQSPGVPA